MMSKEGIHYQIDFDGIDTDRFDFSANSNGIVDHTGQPSMRQNQLQIIQFQMIHLLGIVVVILFMIHKVMILVH